MTLRQGMQLPTVTCAWAKRSDWEASLSMFGVVPASLLPNTPTESALMSSTVSSKIFGRAAEDIDTASVKAIERSMRFIISFDQECDPQR